MTQDEIIEMARQVGFEEHQAKFDTRFEPFAKLVAAKAFQDGYEKGVAAFTEAVNLEREACAKLAATPVGTIAAAIRVRGEQA